ncbi:LytR/AlgR family response regulator transcription factor [Neolewinella persica]|uniref:LytR/AlgR family response regulator transcription factor n=1 Tax=Neolewinella persica TaxID=70998 RepID=UPI00036F2937|nr:LytTR family DNA-binding domain-containing protein [Neolewinella persica]
MNRRTIGTVVGLIALVILFETLQQLYYVRKFDLAEDVRFLFLLQRQVYRWLIWLVMAVPLVLAARRLVPRTNSSSLKLLYYALLIGSIVLLDVFLVALIAFPFGGAIAFSWSYFFTEYLAFFTFQKAPLFTLGYIGVCWISALYRFNQELLVEVTSLRDLRQQDKALFRELSKTHQPQESILTIRSGSQVSVVSLEDVHYIAADDYCVNVYLADGRKYVMRKSLKALLEKLPDHFMRVHRKFIINRKAVTQFNTDTPALLLEDGTLVPVSKSKLKKVKEYFGGERLR